MEHVGITATPVSLLERLRRPGDEVAWSQFVQLYTPLLYSWARRSNLSEADAADLLQDVFTTLVQELPAFQYQPGKSFRAWMRTILLNRWRTLQRRRRPQTVPPDQLDALPAHDPPLPDEAEECRMLVARSMALLQPEFPAATWQAFRLYVVDGQPAAEVAKKLQTTVNVVYLARARILKRLREQLAGFLE